MEHGIELRACARDTIKMVSVRKPPLDDLVVVRVVHGPVDAVGDIRVNIAEFRRRASRTQHGHPASQDPAVVLGRG